MTVAQTRVVFVEMEKTGRISNIFSTVNSNLMAWALGERRREFKKKVDVLDLRKLLAGGPFTKTKVLGRCRFWREKEEFS